MPQFARRIPPYKAKRPAIFSWDNFRGGLNTLLRESELKGNELTRAQNIMLIGAGIPTKRWGTQNYFLSGAAGSVRGLKGFYQKDGTNQLLAITDDGYLTQRSNASYSTLTGVSWASGSNVEMTQMDDRMYIVKRFCHPSLRGVRHSYYYLSPDPYLECGRNGTNYRLCRCQSTRRFGRWSHAGQLG